MTNGDHQVAPTLLHVMQNPGTLPEHLLDNPTLLMRESVGPCQSVEAGGISTWSKPLA